MARIRSVRPEFFTSLDVAALSHRARLTWIGLWCYADDDGRGKDDARLVKAAVWPLDDDVTVDDVESDLAELADRGRLIRYEIDGARYFEIPNFKKFQRPNRPTPSTLPAHSVSAHTPLTEDSPPEGRGEEGKGRGESPPPRYCDRHPEGTADPCGRCGEARETRRLWEARKKEIPTPTPPKVDPTPYCPVHDGYPNTAISPCAACAREKESHAAA